MRLTQRQQEIVDFLRDNTGHFQHPPTLDELCAKLGLHPRGSLHKHVQALVAAGFVEPMEICHLSFQPTNGDLLGQKRDSGK